jgi:hypothetical protein
MSFDIFNLLLVIQRFVVSVSLRTCKARSFELRDEQMRNGKWKMENESVLATKL